MTKAKATTKTTTFPTKKKQKCERLWTLPLNIEDYNSAVHWFAAAAEKKNPDAIHALGLLTTAGHGITQSYSKGSDYFLEAARMSGKFDETELLNTAQQAAANIENWGHASDNALQQGYISTSSEFAGAMHDACFGAMKLYRFLSQHGSMKAEYEMTWMNINSGCPADTSDNLSFEGRQADTLARLRSLAQRGYLPAVDSLRTSYIGSTGLSQPERCTEAEKWTSILEKKSPTVALYIDAAKMYYGDDGTHLPCPINLKKGFDSLCKTERLASNAEEKGMVASAKQSFLDQVPSGESPYYLQGCQ